jgi:hypothetical protein
MNKLSKENRKNLAHALLHLRVNRIHEQMPDGDLAWYCGNRKEFVERHVKATAFIESLLKDAQ